MKLHPQRKSPRLQGYDYSKEGMYFVTICAHQRQSLFGYIHDNRMYPNHVGEIAERCWFTIPDHYPTVELDAFVVMPNHVHGIIVLGQGMPTPYAQPEPSVDTVLKVK